MPNEQSIIMDVLFFYRKEINEYPGDVSVFVVWNSADDHKEIVDLLSQFCNENPKFKVFRNTNSTSKCDNLNYALSIIDTDMVLLNDADTIVSAETMCRASIRLFDEGYDIAQAMNTYCQADYIGRPEPENTFFLMQLLVLIDSMKPMNLGMFNDHVPFNGRGGFWKTSMAKRVGFDHRILAEDHDAGYRAMAYHGARGILDINMLCQEREPPTWSDMTSQRIRWETCAFQIRRVLPWVKHSPFFHMCEWWVLFFMMRLSSTVFAQEIPFAKGINEMGRQKARVCAWGSCETGKIR
jgi:cellulose synthase/poly-beta-1,6-N-acetylglucosamine synthase-like glycosyltransferase